MADNASDVVDIFVPQWKSDYDPMVKFSEDVEHGEIEYTVFKEYDLVPVEVEEDEEEEEEEPMIEEAFDEPVEEEIEPQPSKPEPKT